MLAFVGMTHLGLVSSLAAAEKGFKVICIDHDKELIERLNHGNLPVVEPQLPELLKKNRPQITFTTDFGQLKTCPLVYVAPDIPTDSSGQSDLQGIEKLISTVAKKLSKGSTLVILSQVPPGFTRKISYAQTYYQVETLIFGNAVDRALYPERFIVGGDPELPAPYRKFLEAFGCPILTMSYESAELSKIAINMFLVSQVSTTNTIASLCEKIGANFKEIAAALKLDKRIGPHSYLAPGLGISGGNLERDLATFTSLSDKYGTDNQIVQAWQKNSEHQSHWVLRKICSEVLTKIKSPIFGLLGLSYKKDTASIKNSPALKLLTSLTPYQVMAYDPVVKMVPHTHPKLQFSKTAQDVCQKSDVILIMTPWDEFKTVETKKKIVIDPFGLLSIKSESYYTIGVK